MTKSIWAPALLDLAFCTRRLSCWNRKGPSTNSCHKVGSTESSRMSLYAVALRFPFPQQTNNYCLSGLVILLLILPSRGLQVRTGILWEHTPLLKIEGETGTIFWTPLWLFTSQVVAYSLGLFTAPTILQSLNFLSGRPPTVQPTIHIEW